MLKKKKSKESTNIKNQITYDGVAWKIYQKMNGIIFIFSTIDYIIIDIEEEFFL